jgi:hypothetical protein
MGNTTRVKWIGTIGAYRIDWDRATGYISRGMEMR